MPAVVSLPRGPLGALAADAAKVVRFTKAGAQTAVALAATEIFYNDTDSNLSIRNVRTTLGTAPTGATFITDILVAGTSIYTGVTANRPTIAISAFTALGGTPATLVMTPGQTMTVTVAQIGSTVAGSDLCVQVTFDTGQ